MAEYCLAELSINRRKWNEMWKSSQTVLCCDGMPVAVVLDVDKMPRIEVSVPNPK